MKEKRMFDVKIAEQRGDSDGNHEMIVEGYAVVFESPQTYEYTEVIDRNSLNTTDMKDCVLRYNHSSEAFSLARTTTH